MTEPEDNRVNDTETPLDGRFRIPIATLLVVGFGALTLVAVATVLYVGIYSGGRNTVALLTDKAELIQEAVESNLHHQLDPAQRQSRYLVRLFDQGVVDPANRQQIIDTLRGALAATPQVTGIGFAWSDATALRVGRVGGEIRVLTDSKGITKSLTDAMRTLQRDRKPYWGEPVWSQELGATLLTYRAPITIDGKLRGALIIAISLADLSRFLSTLSEGDEIEAVILSDREYVIAHKNLSRGEFEFTDFRRKPPLPRIDEINDPVIAQMWADGELDAAIEEGNGFSEIGIIGEVVRIGNRGEYFQISVILGYGPSAWMTVIHFPAREVGEEILRLIGSAVLGLVVLVLAVFGSLMIGRVLARRIGIVAAAAQSLQNLDFENTPHIPDSRFKELALAARAFNSMIQGLRWFEIYVPKSLVLRLIRGGGADALASRERAVTIMFTDIRGFSEMAQRMDAKQIASLLNEHFSLMGECIEAEGGTVDKFIGDAVMAFWGAPEEEPDHAARALRAAKAMVAALDRENERRVADGLAPVAMRAAIHTGPVVVGNIGSKSRINYTIVGDAVNTAARLEELAATLHTPDSAWVVLASEETVRAGGEAGFVSIGPRPLRGLSGEVGVYCLQGRCSDSGPVQATDVERA